MAKADQIPVTLRLTIERPVPGVRHSLQGKDDQPLDPQTSLAGEPIAFDVAIRVGPGAKVFGDQVRREGPVRRFVYVRIGQLAGDPSSPWSRRMKIDIHDLDPALVDRAAAEGGVIATTVDGTARDGTPACATLQRSGWRLIPR